MVKCRPLGLLPFLFSTSAAFSQLRRDARRSSLISEATTAIGDSITLLLESSYLKRFEPTEITSLVSAVTAAVRARQHSSSHKETIASMLKGVASRVASSDLLLTSMAAALEEQKSNGYSSRAWEGGITVEEMELVRRSFVLQPAYFTPPSFRAVFENPYFLIVDKPCDMAIELKPSQRPRFPGETSVVEWAKERRASSSSCTSPPTTSPAFFRPCHSLDYATSGLLVLAKTQEALSAGATAFDSTARGRRNFQSVVAIEKEYLAIVLGWAPDTMHLDAPLGPDPESDFKMRVGKSLATEGEGAIGGGGTGHVVDEGVAARWGPSRLPPARRWAKRTTTATTTERGAGGGAGGTVTWRAASTRAIRLRRGRVALAGPLRGQAVSLLRVTIATGRRHQIRAHLATAGHPILGDVAYAGDLSTYRLMLHAHRVTFRDGPAATTPSSPSSSTCPSLSSSAAVEAVAGSERQSTGRRARKRRRLQQERAEGGGIEKRQCSSRPLFPAIGVPVSTSRDPFEGVAAWVD